MADQARFDPLRQLAVLERHRVAFVIVGPFAGVVHGTDLATDELEILPSLRPENVARLQAALAELGAQPPTGETFDPSRLDRERRVSLGTESGRLVVVPAPPGTRGYDDVRRAASREPLGQGLRPQVAASVDLLRIANAAEESSDPEYRRRLARLNELERDFEVSSDLEAEGPA